MEIRETLEEMINKMEEKYRHMIEVSRLTDELEETLQCNDEQSIIMVMTMRAQEMDTISILDQEIQELIYTLDGNTQRAIKNPQLSEKIPSEIKHYSEIRERIHRIVEQTIKKDRQMSEKIAGGASFYAK